MIFARKMPEFYIIIARKIFFPKFKGSTCPPAPRLLRLWRLVTQTALCVYTMGGPTFRLVILHMQWTTLNQTSSESYVSYCSAHPWLLRRQHTLN